MIRAIAFAIVLSASPALAQSVCAPHDAIMKLLLESHGERLAMRGVTETGNVVEILMSVSGTWTILHVQPNGLACLMAAGEGFEKVKPVKPAGKGT